MPSGFTPASFWSFCMLSRDTDSMYCALSIFSVFFHRIFLRLSERRFCFTSGFWLCPTSVSCRIAQDIGKRRCSCVEGCPSLLVNFNNEPKFFQYSIGFLGGYGDGR